MNSLTSDANHNPDTFSDQPALNGASQMGHLSPVVDSYSHMPAEHQAALYLSERRVRELNQRVSSRALSVLLVGLISTVLTGISSVMALSIFLSSFSALGMLFCLILFAQFGMAVYLIFAKDTGLVELVLKIFIFFQILGLLTGKSNSVYVVQVLAGLALAVYAYFRVKSLSR